MSTPAANFNPCDPSFLQNQFGSYALGTSASGRRLAHLEAQVALEAFLRRCKKFERAGNEALPRVGTFVMRGARKLPITFTPE